VSVSSSSGPQSRVSQFTNSFSFSFIDSSLLLVYEGKDDESERLSVEAPLAKANNSSCCHYDADISNCSTELNASQDHQCSSNDENDVGIGHEDETNLDQCLYEDERRPQISDVSDEEPPQNSKFLQKPNANRPISPHSMDSWLNYSNSSDEYSTQELIVRKGINLNLHVDENTQDDDVDVYDKINFVNSKSKASFAMNKKSKISETPVSSADSATANPFLFPMTSPSAVDVSNSKMVHDTAEDDGIEVGGLEEEEDDDQLSSLSSNIDTIIVSDNGETKFFNSSGEQEEYPSSKKKKSAAEDSCGGDQKKSNNGSNNNSSSTNGQSSKTNPSSLVDVRIIDFAHTTFTLKNPAEMMSPANNKVHHGPDGGFLTGINTLKRILSEIIVEESI